MSAPDLSLGLASLNEPQPSLASTDPLATTDEGPASGSPPAPESLLADRYELLEEIAHGGMGVVVRCRDHHLHRDLAVKVLHEKFRDRADINRRFLEEARVAGQLQHPGVVPIHELGSLPDGRPFFAMKLVRGCTLADLLDQRPDPAHDRQRVLNVFVQVCQAVAYAHSKGVIHRDLKPANIMVGAFGEVQVMDWGLAKVLGADPGRDLNVPVAAPSADTLANRGCQPLETGEADSATQAGSVLGTFAYMPPEQAQGEIHRLNRRSDVFGLGAILCEMLTGRPPHFGSGEQVQAQARQGDLTSAFGRLQTCGADPELVALATACLAPRAEDRPADATAVAEAVSVYLASVERRLRQAELERAASQARAAEGRKRRRLALAAALVVAALLGLAGVAGWRVWRQQEQRWAEAQDGLTRAGELQQKARLQEVRSTLEQVRAQLGDGGPAELRHQLDSAQANLSLTERLEAIRMLKLVLVTGLPNLPQIDSEYAQAFDRAGIGRVGEAPDLVAGRVQDSAIKEQLVAALDDWACTTRNNEMQAWLLAVVCRADPDELRVSLRDPTLWNDPAALQRRLEGIKPGDLPPMFLAALGQKVFTKDGLSIGLFQAAHRKHPDDPWLALTLATGCMTAGRMNEAIGYGRAALAVRPEDPNVWVTLGLLVQMNGQLDEAIAHYRRATAFEPPTALCYRCLGLTLQARGLADEPLVAYRKAFDLDPAFFVGEYDPGTAPKVREEAIEKYRLGAQYFLKMNQDKVHQSMVFLAFLPQDPVQLARLALKGSSNSAWARIDLAEALRVRGKSDEALVEVRKVIEIEPGNARAHLTLGRIFHDRRQLDEAVAEYHQASALDPRDAAPHVNLGVVFFSRGRQDEAIAQLRQGVALDPRNAQTHIMLAEALREKGLFDEAITQARKAIEIDPKNVCFHIELGSAFFRNQQLDEAQAEFRKAIDLDPRDSKAPSNLCVVLLEKGVLDEALAHGRKAVALNPGDYKAHNILGRALLRNGLAEEAIAEYRKAIALEPRYAPAHQNLGKALQEQGRLDEAVAEFRSVLENNPKDAWTLQKLGHVLEQRGRLDEAVAALRSVLEINPKYAWAHHRLGSVLVRQGRFTAARAATRNALEQTPATDPLRPALTALRDLSERLLSLEPKLSDMLQGVASAADAEDHLALAQLCQLQQKRAAAVRWYAEAFEDRPKLASAPRNTHRYNAACYAALAGCGQGEDAPQDDQERSRLRQQALAWLKADLEFWKREAASADARVRDEVRRKLRHWQIDPDLERLRNADALAQLPVAERDAWLAFWGEFAAVLAKVAEGK